MPRVYRMTIKFQATIAEALYLIHWKWWTLSCVLLVILAATPSRGQPHSSAVPVLGVDKSRLEIGESQLRELESKADHSPCWREAVRGLDLSCKQLSDIQQSRLAVAFANCHLEKSGRQTYPCNDDMTIRECTGDMDHDAYQTYTHFFTHAGHICYFLQIELWQGRTEGLIGRLSDTSSQAVEKLEQSLEYHRAMDGKQDTALRNQDLIIEQDRKIASSLQEARTDMETSFSEMSTMAEQQKALLGEMFASLQASVDAVRGLMSLMLVEFIGWETVAVFAISWLVVMLLPQYRYSRFKMIVLLVAEVVVEVCVRRVYGYMILGGETPPQDLAGLHSVLWGCRYVCAAVSVTLYLWEWYHFLDYGERNYRMLTEIRQLVRSGRTGGGFTLSDGSSDQLRVKGDPQAQVAISLPGVPHRTVQPVVHGFSHYISPPAPPDVEDPDTPDSTHEPHHTTHHATLSTTHYGGGAVCSSDEEMPDNDRALRTKNPPRPGRVHRSSRQPPVVSRQQHSPSPSPSLLLASQLSSDEREETVSLTRTPIRSKHNSGLHKSRATDRSAHKRLHNKDASGVGDHDNRFHHFDSEPEKEVMEEKDVPSAGGRGLRSSSDLLTGQQVPATPTMISSRSQRSSHAPRSRQSRSSTPVTGSAHRYNLRARTPQQK